MHKFEIYQIDCKVYTKKDIILDYVLSEISGYVDNVLAIDSKMLELHRAYGFKNYVISGFKELEKDKRYKEGRIYTFSVRCVQKDLCDFFYKNLGEGKTASLKGLTATVKIIPKHFIEKIYTITPAVIKVAETGYWRGTLSLEQYEKRLFDNAVKKYKKLTGEEFDEDFSLYRNIRFLNQKPISLGYKSIHLLGDKLELEVSENEVAQQIAYILLGIGICENNSRGCGYLNYKAI